MSLKSKTPKTLTLIENEPDLVLAITKNKPALDRLMLTIQMELVSEENKEHVGHVVYAIKEIVGIFDSMEKNGKALIEKNNSKK